MNDNTNKGSAIWIEHKFYKYKNRVEYLAEELDKAKTEIALLDERIQKLEKKTKKREVVRSVDFWQHNGNLIPSDRFGNPVFIK
jgi:ppGpp synthetase/RelA/SpoT-type nucleotidyltranferase